MSKVGKKQFICGTWFGKYQDYKGSKKVLIWL